MSAMYTRVSRVASPRRNQVKMFRSLAGTFTAPIADAIPISIPRGRASTRQFALIVIGTFVSGMLLLLFVNTMASQESFEKHAVQLELAQITSDTQALQQQVIKGESVENLTKVAYRMGMVPVQSPAFLRLNDKQIIGKPQPASSQGR